MQSFGELHAAIGRALGADRHRLRSLLRGVEQAAAAGKPFDKSLARLQKELEASQSLRQLRLSGRPVPRFDNDLPITARREDIAKAIADNQVVVVCGETGSGKSTQLPQICLELGRGVDGLIGHTQPRRIAARNIASRVAQELAVPLGQAVGFKIRFTDSTGPRTYVKLMTDGILLAESQNDRFLNQYDTIILDEAHERSLNIDFLIGYLKQLLPKRRDLRLIITSATIDAARFAEHFASAAGPAPVIEVSGRTYPVDVLYRPLVADEETGDTDWRAGVLAAVDELARLDRGDMLIFMPTEHDIHETAKALRGHSRLGEIDILPLYARLSTAEQNRVFAPHGRRRIVIATNVAESSLTVPGIRFVIDTGTARISRYAPRSKIQRLPIEPISQASADQRMGRCGRIGPGVCIRLYSEADYLARDRYTPPEIQRSNLAAVILQAIALRLGPIEEFPFLDPPRGEAIRDGYRTLFELGAIEENRPVAEAARLWKPEQTPQTLASSATHLTEIGRQLARLPVDPRIGRIILAGHAENCLHEVLIIAAGLEMQDPRERPREKAGTADESHAKFAHPESDFLSYLKLWDFCQHLKGTLSRSQFRKACQQNFLSHNRLREWFDIHRQLLQWTAEAGLKQQPRRDDADAIHRALLTGLLSSVAYRGESHEYTVAGGQKVLLWPGSAAFGQKPKWIVAAEVIETSRRYARCVGRINPDWIEPLAGHLVNRSYSEPHWSAASGAVMAFERVSLWGLVVVPRRRVPYGRIDPGLSRQLFIQHALVQGEYFEGRAGGVSPPSAVDYTTRVDDVRSPSTRGANAPRSPGAPRKLPPFLAHNLQLVEELRQLEIRARRHDLLRDDDVQLDFYHQRVPEDVFDRATFEQWRRRAEQKEPQLLFMRREDLARDTAAKVSPDDFPARLATRGIELPVDYRFEPGADDDGLTLTVPKEGLNQLDPRRLGWLVPGLLEEKITALLKTLPKSLRRNLVPMPDTAKKVLAAMQFAEGDLLAGVARVASRIAGEPISPRDFQPGALPTHLRMNIRVVDAEGKPVAQSRELPELRGQIGVERLDEAVETADPRWNRDGITTWDFGELPDRIEIHRGGLSLPAYPGLLDRGESVSLRLFDSPERAAAETHAALRTLFYLACRRELRSQADWLPGLDRWLVLARDMGQPEEIKQQLAALIAERAFLADDSTPTRRVSEGIAVSADPRLRVGFVATAEDFEARLKTGRKRLGLAVQEVARVAAPLFENHHQVRLALERATAPSWRYAVEDIRQQLTHLTPPGFLTFTPWRWLEQYPRYLQAIRIRLEKLSGDGLARDRRHAAEIGPRWEAYQQLLRRQTEHGHTNAQLADYRWLLEEYRVSLFAQQLGTSLPISPKRLDAAWKEIDRR